MTKGVLIIALGHSYYGHLAANLAASIRYTAKDMPVHLAHDAEAVAQLSPDRKALFTSTAIVPTDYYHKGDRAVFVKAKTYMLDLTPFDETIFIDADAMLTSGRSLWQAFEELGHLDFTMENRAVIDLATATESHRYLWAEVADIKAAYKLSEGKLYGLHSEFVYFKKNARTKAFFKTVKQVFNAPKCKVVGFDGDVPDEFGFAIAMIKHGLYPHQTPYVPLYWYLTDKNKGSSLSYIIGNYYGMSVGGNATPESVKKQYHQLASAYAQRLGVGNPFRLMQKRQVFASRKLM